MILPRGGRAEGGACPSPVAWSSVARVRTTWLLGIAVAIAALVLPAVANGALSTTTTLPTAAGATRIVVTVNGLGTVPARQRPTAVSVVGGGSTYKLAKVNNRRWRSAKLSAGAVTKLRALKGKRVNVRIRSKAGTRTLRSVLRVPAATGGGTPVTPPPTTPPGTTPPPLFEAQASPLEGEAAFNHISRYFLNSRFTDCAAGAWPACAVEERYNHCPDETWQYYRLTPTSGSDINAVGSFQVTGAAVGANGSWGVSYYVPTYGSNYRWDVAVDGTARGAYWAPGNDPAFNPATDDLGTFRWLGSVPCTSSPY